MSATRTWRASMRSRVPLHSGQAQLFRYFASSSRTVGRIGLPVAPFQVRDDALESMLAQRRFAALVQILERNLGLPAAIQDHLLYLVGQTLEGLFDIEVVVSGESGE